YPRDAPADHGRDLGDLHPGSRGRREVQVRNPDRGRNAAEEDRPVRRVVRGAAADGGDRPRYFTVRVGRWRLDGGAASGWRVAEPADVDLRSPSRFVGED